jgi:RNA polymerase sigma factor (TIGR02999 family)
MPRTRGEVTRLVERWSRGDATALDRLIELAYDDLRQIASRHLRGQRPGHTIETTALVHELYLRLAGVSANEWGGRAQFFAFCSKAMRHILIDYARRRQAMKRGGAHIQVPLEENSASVDAEAAELLALDEALQALAARNERMARIVECRFFGGLSVPETAEAVGASQRTVEREWARARAYLQHLMSAEQDGSLQWVDP